MPPVLRSVGEADTRARPSIAKQCDEGELSAASSEKLISAFYHLGEQGKGSLSILDSENRDGGYLSEALYTGSGSHLVLFRISKDEKGAEKITAMCEGSPAEAWDCSVNLAEAGGKTILFGNVKADAMAKGNQKISFQFAGGQAAECQVCPGGGYILVVDGAQKIKDFTVTAKDQKDTGGFTAFLNAGGSVSRASFVEVM